MTERKPVFDAPHGSPAAGYVRVYRRDPETGMAVLVREEDPFDSDLEPGATLESGPGAWWVSRVDAVSEEMASHDPDAAAWTDDVSD